MKRYKLTRQNRTTHNNFQLPADGVWFYSEDRKSTPVACSNTVLHHYSHPLLAVLFNPIYASYTNPRLFEIEVRKEIGTDGLQGWCRAQKIVREIALPQITLQQKVAFGIRVAMLICTDKGFISWANNWLSGVDRKANTAADAADAAYAAHADAAAYAAYAAAYATAHASHAYAAAATYAAAHAAAYAAYAAAAAAADADAKIDFVSIINEVISTQE